MLPTSTYIIGHRHVHSFCVGLSYKKGPYRKSASDIITLGTDKD